jgi:hypothetical protein
MVPWTIMEMGDVDRFIGRHRRKVVWGPISIDRMFGGEEDVEEKIEYSFWRDASYIADRDTMSLVLRREVYLRRWFIKRKSAFLTEHQAAVNLAFRQDVIPGVRG